MSVQSYIFDFVRVPDFMDKYNLSTAFQVTEMDGQNKNFEFVLATDCPDSIEDCLDQYGALNSSVKTVNIGSDGYTSILYSKGVGNDRTISIGNSQVNLDVGDIDVLLKAMFLRSVRTGYVLAYSINSRSVPITNSVTLPVNGVIWNIKTEG